LPLVIAHRGASALEPENSLAAFRAAVRLGADGIELDVHDTADGVLVVHHDPRLGGRPIRELCAADLPAHALPNGELVPTLPQALAAIGRDCRVFVEVKTLAPEHDPALFVALDGGPAPSRYHVHGFDHRIVRRLTSQRPGLVGGVLSTSYPVDPWRQLAVAGAEELWQEASLIDRALVDGARARDIRLYAWTVDDIGRARELAGLGVDGLCTNRPDLIRSALDLPSPSPHRAPPSEEG
jgi:glycerophosphoryl diester phosphodiesterase